MEKSSGMVTFVVTTALLLPPTVSFWTRVPWASTLMGLSAKGICCSKTCFHVSPGFTEREERIGVIWFNPTKTEPAPPSVPRPASFVVRTLPLAAIRMRSRMGLPAFTAFPFTRWLTGWVVDWIVATPEASTAATLSVTTARTFSRMGWLTWPNRTVAFSSPRTRYLIFCPSVNEKAMACPRW